MGKHTLCVAMTPALQELREFKSFKLGVVNRSLVIHRSPAGKGINVARVLRQLGGDPLLVGFIGGDTGRFMLDWLRRTGVRESLTRVRAPTRICTTVMDHATGAITELVEEAELPSATEWRQFFATFRRRVSRARCVVISGALMPGAAPEVYAKLARRAGAVIVDSQRAPLLCVIKQQPLLAKLNVHELENTLGRRFRTESQIIAGARRLLDAGAQHVVVTHGAHGAWLVTTAGVWHYRPPRLKPVNPIGSGDAMTAGICRKLEQGSDMVAAVRYGVACGAANALTILAGLIDLKDVRRLLPRVMVRERR